VTLQQILDGMASVLENWPLYRPFSYEGDNWTPMGGSMSVSYHFSIPRIIRMHCSDHDCQNIQTWGLRDRPYFGINGTVENSVGLATYECRNCQRSRMIFALLVVADRSHGEIMKIGQWPPLSREPDPVVTSGWSKPDLTLYRDAMTFRNSNKGIGALPYLRRIIENHIHDILDLIADANNRSAIHGFKTEMYETVRKGYSFAAKLEFARDFLPANLTPAGSPNPIGTLYELISDGLHARSEEECVDIFDGCKAAFEYVVKKLTDAKRDDEDYIESVRKLSEK
jgi:hypothetical protein